MTSYTFRKASDVNEPTPLLVGIAGGTGSGKTFSAFRLARGIVGPQGRIAMLDTEKRRPDLETIQKIDTATGGAVKAEDFYPPEAKAS